MSVVMNSPERMQNPAHDYSAAAVARLMEANPEFRRQFAYALKETLDSFYYPSAPHQKYKPRMDFIDYPLLDKYTAVVEVPGIKPSDLRVSISNGCLEIWGEREMPSYLTPLRAPREVLDAATEQPTSGESNRPPPTLHRQELRFGEFYRRIRVPTGLKESDVSAVVVNGMLTMAWPKRPDQPLNPGHSNPSRRSSSRGSNHSNLRTPKVAVEDMQS